jgi:hypothetical protein
VAYTPTSKIKASAFVGLMIVALTSLPAHAQTRITWPVHGESAARSPSAGPGTLAGPIFRPAVTYSTGDIIRDIAIVDINRDQKPDLLVTGVADDNTGLISVFLGNGDGSFQYPSGFYSTAGQAVTFTLLRDVNGDGKPDVLVAEACAGWLNNCVSGDALAGVLLNNGDGTFQPAVIYNPGGFTFASSIAVADVNGDGKPDMIVTDLHCTSTGFDGCVSVLLGNGNGSFQPATVYASGGLNSQDVVVADVNSDGKPDLVVTNAGNSPSMVGVLLGNGDGTFQPAASYDSGGGFALGLMTPDLNHDKHPDLLVANVYSDNISVLLNNGDGTFRAAVAYPSGGQGIVATVLKDINGDSHPDLVLANCGTLYGFCPGSGSVDVLLGNADGTFGPAVGYGSWGFPQSPEDLLVADLNRDGHADIAVIASFSATITVLPGNGDGTFQAGILYNSGTYKASVVRSADLDGTGTPDLVVGGADSLGQGIIGVLLNTTPAHTP